MSSNYCNIFCIRFDFGLPLEDINPPNDVHPKIKTLLKRAYMAVAQTHVKVDKILKCQLQQGTITEGLRLKDHFFTDSYTHYYEPGALLWILRHFLGLLPLPIFPSFTDNQKFNFDWLALLCRMKKRVTVQFLNLEIAKTLTHLPRANFILIDYLMGFFRRIIGCRTGYLERKSTLAVVEYFSSAMYVRPYMPGYDTLRETLYYPLTYHLIINWPKIKQIGPYELEINQELKQTLLFSHLDDEGYIENYKTGRKKRDNNIEMTRQKFIFSKKRNEDWIESEEKKGALNKENSENEDFHKIEENTYEKIETVITNSYKLDEDLKNKNVSIYEDLESSSKNPESFQKKENICCSTPKNDNVNVPSIAKTKFPKKSLSRVFLATQKYFLNGKLPKDEEASGKLKQCKSEENLARFSGFSLKKIKPPIKFSSLKYRKLLTI